MAFESLGRGDGDLNTTLILSRIVPSDKLIVLFLSRHHQRATHEAHASLFVVLILQHWASQKRIFHIVPNSTAELLIYYNSFCIS